MLTLYTTALSGNGRKPMAVARYLSLDINERIINVYTGEGQDTDYRAFNPWGKIPTLLDGDLVLWESNAILLHLAESHGDFTLSCRDSRDRANMLRWLFWESAHWQPVLSRVIAAYVKKCLFHEPDDIRPPDWSDPELVAQMAVLESLLTTNDYLCGKMITIADFSIAGMTTYFSSCGFPYPQYPALSAWLARMQNIPAWRATETSVWST